MTSPRSAPPDQTGAVLIRPYQESDWPAICRVHDLARPDELAGSCDPRAFIPLDQDPESDELRQNRIFVAEDGGQVIGFVGVLEDYLGWLYVHPRYYGRGIGRRLLQKGKGLIPGKAWTIALAGNTRALKLYGSEGFVEVDRYQSQNAGYPCTCLRLEMES